MEENKKLYQCPICKLHYLDLETAKKCENWCKKYNACSLEITKFAVENQKRKYA